MEELFGTGERKNDNEAAAETEDKRKWYSRDYFNLVELKGKLVNLHPKTMFGRQV